MSPGDIGSLTSGLLGIGTAIGTAIPGLKKPKRSDASAAAVRNAQNAVANKAVGASQTGHGASRGLNLREGLRSASALVASAAGQGAAAAHADETRFNDQMTARNERLAQFGGGISDKVGAMAQALIQPKSDDDSALEGQPEGDENATGLTGDNAAKPKARGGIDLQSPSDGFVDPDGPNLDELEEQFAEEEHTALTPDELQQMADQDGAGPSAQFQSRAAFDEVHAAGPTTAAPEIEQDLDNRLQAKRLMLQDAERLGIILSEVYAPINRKFQLKPGQSTANPMGLSLDFEGEE
jgi:hypothetical protein